MNTRGGNDIDVLPKNIELWEIHTFGTSFTKGGGFEFKVNPQLKEFYKDEDIPKTQFDFSWPGRLQELILDNGYKSRVYNHAESGYGYEKTIRDAHSIISDSRNHLDDKLFIFEFGGFGRKDHYINEMGYLISNWHFKTKKSDFQFVVDDDDEDIEIITHGIAKKYFEDTDEVKKDIKRFEPIIEKFNSETLEMNSRHNKMGQEIVNFIGFLNIIGAKYILASVPMLPFDYHKNFHHLWEGKIVKYKIDDKNHKIELDLYGFLEKSKLRISDETSGLINDNHGGLRGNTKIAKHIFEKIEEDYIYALN